jgi:stage II sporulation protein D
VKLLACAALLPLLAAAAGPTVKVRLGVTNGSKTVDLPIETYVAATLAGESGGFQSDEALKAMAVAARTYAVRMRGRHQPEGFDLCDTTHCQRLDLHGITARIQKIAAETAGELLWYRGKPAFTPYTKDCGGMSEDAAAVWPDMAAPYLRPHADPYCLRASSPWRWSANPRQIIQALSQSRLRVPASLERITIATRTSSGRASTLQLLGRGESIRIAASSFRFAIGRLFGWNTVRSDRYEIHPTGAGLLFEGSGDGHGVGLCQIGADEMGSEKKSWREILAFYYPDTTIGRTSKGLNWQTLHLGTISLETVRPDQDRVILPTSGRLLRAIAARLSWPTPPGITIRAYPDLDTFRDATGEPGWVGARTTGRRIELQTVEVLTSRHALDSTLSHELLHVVVESRIAPGAPVWFREGLVEYLDHNSTSAASPTPSDMSLQQKSDEAIARAAYRDAAAAVSRLVKTYGETTVLGWVTSGLPRSVTNASNNHAAPNSR